MLASAAALFQGSNSRQVFVVKCKGCGENVPTGRVEFSFKSTIVACPLCHDTRRYLPSEVFKGRVSQQLIKKPVRSAPGGAS
jgi:ribosomal protein S27E